MIRSVFKRTNTKVITPTNQNRGKQRDEPIGIPTSNLLKTREVSRLQVAIGFTFASY